MPLFAFEGKRPRVHPTAFVAPTAVLVGDVTVEERASVWYNAVLRADFSPIVVRVSPEGDGYRIRVDNFTRVPVTFNDLAEFLKDVQGNPGFDDETPVVIMPEEDVAWDHVVGCWNAAVRASYKQIMFGST